MASPSIYAPSNQSSCKICSNIISADSLRLGLDSKDPGDYDVTKCRHLNRFPVESQLIHGSEEGVSSLKSSDQQALVEVSGEKRAMEGNGDEEKSSKKSKYHSDPEFELNQKISPDSIFIMPIGASPRSNHAWTGGASVAMVVENGKVIILAADFGLSRNELKPKYERNYYEADRRYYYEKSETGFLHELDNVTACAVVGSQSIGGSWYGKLESELGTLINRDSMTNKRKIKETKGFKLFDASLKILSAYKAKELHEQKKPLAEVLLVGWNKQREPCLHHLSNHGDANITEGHFWAGGNSRTAMRESDYKPEMSRQEAATYAQKMIYSRCKSTQIPGDGVEVWVLQQGLPIQKNVESMEDLRLKFEGM